MKNKIYRECFRRWPIDRGRGKVFHWACRNLHGFTLSQMPDSSRLLLDLDQFIDASTYLRGGYEVEECVEFGRICDAHGCDMYVDVGAHIGVFAVQMFRQGWANDLRLFEPDPRNRSRLKMNLILNDLWRISTVHSLALSDRSNTTRFFPADRLVDRESGKLNTGTSSLTQRDHRNTGSSIEIRTSTLDEVFEDVVDRRVALKIDVEGLEEAVLSGAQSFMARNACVIMVEAWMSEDPEAEAVGPAKVLSNSGYSLHRQFGDNYIYVRSS